MLKLPKTKLFFCQGKLVKIQLCYKLDVTCQLIRYPIVAISALDAGSLVSDEDFWSFAKTPEVEMAGAVR